MTISRIVAVIALCALGFASIGCGKSQEEIPIPAPDPKGKDIVAGAIVAAAEKSGGIRLYKVVHVDDYPEPMGFEYHLIAYDPKVNTFQEAALMRRDHRDQMKVALPHLVAEEIPFLRREHRVLAVEPLTDDEKQAYIRSRDSRK